MSKEDSVTGGCLCGAVRFQARFPSKWCAHCHCSMCRKEHGAGYVTWAGFEESQFELLQGANQLIWYRSSAPAERGFCSQCGSSMLFRSQRWPGEIHVALGCLDGPIDRQPAAHIFHDSRVDWVAIDDALALYNPD